MKPEYVSRFHPIHDGVPTGVEQSFIRFPER